MHWVQKYRDKDGRRWIRILDGYIEGTEQHIRIESLDSRFRL